jgi:hypothetical protein
MRATATQHRRAGVTLIEVVVAIFVVALGLLALLTLFPLGALSMAQAIKDDRVAQTAANAAATIKVMDILSDTNITGSMNPGNALPASGPSMAVYFDPIGNLAYLGPAKTQVGGVAGVTRTSTNAILTAGNPRQLIAAWFTSLDDMTFTNDNPQRNLPRQVPPALGPAVLGVPAADDGLPALDPINGQVFTAQREGRYAWAAMLRRPRVAEQLTEVYIVVYSARSVSLSGSLVPAGETPLSVVAIGPVPGTQPYTTITVNLPGGAVPDIRAGGWVLDATNAPGHGDFYRVTNVTLNGNNTADLELQTPLKTAGLPTVINQVVLMDGVAEVIFKGVITP